MSTTPSLHQWLLAGLRADASDLHLVADRPPVLRIHGSLQEVVEPPLEAGALRDLLTDLCPDALREKFEAEKHVDFSWTASLEEVERRFRVNVFHSGQEIGACFRFIPDRIPELNWAGFPVDVAERLVGFRNGLVLMSGITGSGKSTSLAMIVNLINQRGGSRIITIEEPVEYLFPPADNSLITQREVGVDVRSFAEGLVSGLRQDPDVIFVGEIRDRETARMALTAAETGHLVFSTLHCRDAKGAISRLIDLFPQTVQTEIRSQLAMGLRSVISQQLLPSSTPGTKRELALELLYNTAPVAAGIRQGKLESIDNCILTGAAEGMRTLGESVKRLWEDGRISQETADRYLVDPNWRL